jgi:hypothetical protein
VTAPTIVGVRHHSPACARRVRRALETVEPATVLIEGPMDMNDRLDELLLDGHVPPLAIFSTYRDDDRQQASWTPFARFSPEWVALTEGHARGAEVRFMDLPAWSSDFHAGPNRYADTTAGPLTAFTQTLCARLGIDTADALWDHLFEQGDDPTPRLFSYFEAIRAPDDELLPSPADAAREETMARCVAWAARRGPAVVVCGGWHAPMLRRTWRAHDGTWPTPPSMAPAARQASYLVPFSDTRLDRFTGYAAGMPHPAWYAALWDDADPVETLLGRVVSQLRAAGFPVSTADLVAVRTTLRGLASLRGHREPTRTDVLDALASALISDAVDEPHPWSTDAPPRRPHPVVRTLMRVFGGEAQGTLDPRTPRPPLLDAVHQALQQHGLDAGEHTLDLHDAADLARSRVLHRLVVLGVPGFIRLHGPRWATDADLTERWRLTRDRHRDTALIEAAGYGATLEAAATAKLDERLRDARSAGELVEVLAQSLAAGLDTLPTTTAERVRSVLAGATDPGDVGQALIGLLALWRVDTPLTTGHDARIGALVDAAFDRCLLVLDGLPGAQEAPADRGRIAAMTGIRDALRFGPDGLARSTALTVLQRLRIAPSTPPDVRGGALGILWDRGDLTGADVQTGLSDGALGDTLAGLFAVAREHVLQAPDLLAGIDARLGALDDGAFVELLPSLRQAFATFPPRERDRIARQAVDLHDAAPSTATRVRARMTVTPEAIAAARERLARVERRRAEWGLP